VCVFKKKKKKEKKKEKKVFVGKKQETGFNYKAF